MSPMPVWVLSLGRRLAFEGVFLCLALGVGSFFLPLASSGVGSRDVGADNRLAAFAYAAAGLAVIGGLAVEVAGAPRVGALMRGAVSTLVRGGSSYCSQSDIRAHFGLGDRTTADVLIHWPSGVIDRPSKGVVGLSTASATAIDRHVVFPG